MEEKEHPKLHYHLYCQVVTYVVVYIGMTTLFIVGGSVLQVFIYKYHMLLSYAGGLVVLPFILYRYFMNNYAENFARMTAQYPGLKTHFERNNVTYWFAYKYRQYVLTVLTTWCPSSLSQRWMYATVMLEIWEWEANCRSDWVFISTSMHSLVSVSLLTYMHCPPMKTRIPPRNTDTHSNPKTPKNRENRQSIPNVMVVRGALLLSALAAVVAADKYTLTIRNDGPDGLLHTSTWTGTLSDIPLNSIADKTGTMSPLNSALLGGGVTLAVCIALLIAARWKGSWIKDRVEHRKREKRIKQREGDKSVKSVKSSSEKSTKTVKSKTEKKQSPKQSPNKDSPAKKPNPLRSDTDLSQSDKSNKSVSESTVEKGLAVSGLAASTTSTMTAQKPLCCVQKVKETSRSSKEGQPTPLKPLTPKSPMLAQRAKPSRALIVTGETDMLKMAQSPMAHSPGTPRRRGRSGSRAGSSCELMPSFESPNSDKENSLRSCEVDGQIKKAVIKKRNDNAILIEPVTTTEFREYMKSITHFISNYHSDPYLFSPGHDSLPGVVFGALPRHMPVKPDAFDDIFSDMQNMILKGMCHSQHPRFHALSPHARSLPDIIADAISAAIPAGSLPQEACPSLYDLERAMCNWLVSAFSLPNDLTIETSTDKRLAGILESRLEATLNAVYAMRQKMLCKAGGDASKLVVYASTEASRDVWRACRLAGMRLHSINGAIDSQMALTGNDLFKAILQDQSSGLIPCGVVACVGVGLLESVDHLTAIAQFTDKYGMWLHIDGPQLAARVVPGIKTQDTTILQGLNRASSIAIKLNSYFPTSSGATAYWSRDPLTQRAVYGEPTKIANYPAWRLSPPTRQLMLNVWMVARLIGKEPLTHHVKQMKDMCEYFHSQLCSFDRVRVVGKPGLSSIALQLIDPTHDEEKTNRLTSVYARLLADTKEMTVGVGHIQTDGLEGTVHCSSMTVLRVCVSAPRILKCDIDETVMAMKKVAEELDHKKECEMAALFTRAAANPAPPVFRVDTVGNAPCTLFSPKPSDSEPSSLKSPSANPPVRSSALAK